MKNLKHFVIKLMILSILVCGMTLAREGGGTSGSNGGKKVKSR